VPSLNRTTTIIVISLIIALSVSIFLTIRTLTFFNDRPPSAAAAHFDNSYLFASPLSAKADSKESIRITAIILDSLGQGVANQTIELHHSPSLKADSSNPVTDETGKATFDLVANGPGKYTVSARTEDFSIAQTVTIEFY
jgi:hypothetical protein